MTGATYVQPVLGVMVMASLIAGGWCWRRAEHVAHRLDVLHQHRTLLASKGVDVFGEQEHLEDRAVLAVWGTATAVITAITLGGYLAAISIF